MSAYGLILVATLGAPDVALAYGPGTAGTSERRVVSTKGITPLTQAGCNASYRATVVPRDARA